MKLSEAKYSVIDLETTGIDPAIEKVMEFASIDFTLHETKSIRTSLLNPGKPIPIDAKATNNICDYMVQDKPTLQDFLCTYEFKADVYVAHEVKFDFKFLTVPGMHLCTRRLCQKMWPDLPKTNNSYLRYFLGLEYIPELEGLSLHRAVADAIVTSYSLEKMLDILISQNPEMQVEDLITWIEAPILQNLVRFGKYKGQHWNQVPIDYLIWVNTNMTDLDSDSKFTLNHYINEVPF
jgi:exodeoxyribonuclease X